MRRVLISMLACLIAQTGQASPVPDTSPLDKGEGYLLVAVSTPRLHFESLTLNGRSEFEFDGADFDDDINYRLIRLPAGNYHWSRMFMSGTAYYFKFDKSDYPLSVKEGHITYGGLFLAEAVGATRGSIRVVNRLTPALDFMEVCCSQLLEDYPLHFGRPGADPFVTYYSSLDSSPAGEIGTLPTGNIEDTTPIDKQLPAQLAYDYFRRSKFEQLKISPGGRYVMMFEVTNNLRELVLFDPASASKHTIMAERSGDVNSRRDIRSASWIDDQNILFTYQWARTEHMALGRIVYEDGIAARVKVYRLENDWYLLDPLPGVENHALVVLNDGDHFELYNVDVSDPFDVGIAQPDTRSREKFKDASSRFFDASGQLRATVALDHEKGDKVLWYRSLARNRWYAAWRGSPSVRMEPVLVDNDDRTITVISNEQTEHAVLKTYDWQDEEYVETVFALPGQDIERVITDPLRKRIIAVTSIEDGLVRQHYLDDKEPLFERYFTGGKSPYIVEQSLDERFAIVRTSTSDDPGAYYWIDTEGGTLVEVGVLRPWLSRYRLGKSRSVLTTTSDELTIESYLTLPDAASYPRPPLVVMPHGGPISVRDTKHFDSTVQLLATLGYAVLQTNYRGSRGSGKSFEAKGYGQWGRNIEDDIDAALAAVIELDLVDEEKVCIFGSSYGGYSALISSILRPERFACAASFAGVTDLALLFHEARVTRSNLTRSLTEKIVGDPETDLETLLQFSPAFHADEITTPILLAHGVKDDIVDVEHFHRMQKALRSFGKDATFLLFDDEGHGLSYLSSTMEFYAALDRFFRRNMDLPESSLELASSDAPMAE